MKHIVVVLGIFIVMQGGFGAFAAGVFEKDMIETSAGNLGITFIGHGTLMLGFNDKIIHVDPWSRLADYADLPKADLILITHHHQDHLDPQAVAQIRTPDTVVICTAICAKRIENAVVMQNGDSQSFAGIGIQAVPAYNLVHKRDDGQPYHPKGEGNGYILRFGQTRVYIAGDTENTPEMKALTKIDYAFLPMNLPYTMTPAMVADAALAFKPRVLYPYHYGDTDLSELSRLIKPETGIELRIRKMP